MCAALGAAALLWLAPTASATFHLMQIEQVIGGVDGDASAQAIQLRQKSGGQNLVSQARLRVVDAAGLNPITVVDMTTNVPNGGFGSRILIATQSFLDRLDPAIAANFMVTNPIPQSYLAAGSLTFESDGGTVYWRLSWGGDLYTGPNNGSTLNDLDGNYGPPWPGPLPSGNLEALKFQGLAFANSTNNAADYALTGAASTWVNNAGQSGTLVEQKGEPADVNGDGLVNVVDMVEVVLNWGACAEPPAPCDADTNDDGAVDVLDLVGVILAWTG
jgi:hypothetical protein